MLTKKQAAKVITQYRSKKECAEMVLQVYKGPGDDISKSLATPLFLALDIEEVFNLPWQGELAELFDDPYFKEAFVKGQEECIRNMHESKISTMQDLQKMHIGNYLNAVEEVQKKKEEWIEFISSEEGKMLLRVSGRPSWIFGLSQQYSDFTELIRIYLYHIAIDVWLAGYTEGFNDMILSIHMDKCPIYSNTFEKGAAYLKYDKTKFGNYNKHELN